MDELTPQAISGITDPNQIRVVLFINNQMVHAPFGAGVQIVGDARYVKLAGSLGFLYGLTLSNNGSDAVNDIDIAAGTAAEQGVASPVLMTLASALTKRLDAAWAVGTNQGGLDTGSIANGTYHIWLIARSDTGVVDALFSTSASAPTMPTGYDRKRRIGSIVRRTVGTARIEPFIQDNDQFMWVTPVADIAATNPGTAAVTRTLTVPLGLRLRCLLNVGFAAAAAADSPAAIYISDLSRADIAPVVSTAATFSAYYGSMPLNSSGSAPAEIMCNTSGQVRSRIQISAANTILYILTNGWVDTRGRFA